MTKLLSTRQWFRTSAISIVVAALVAGTMTVAWQLALARVPRHRATLERLVQAHTGLDVRFNELGLRWGWYGPEAVFRDVELGEPGGAATLLRAPELTVAFDAWRTMQTGQLRAGRVTLIAPEIDLVTPRSSARRRESAQSDFARVLRRWEGGRIDVESGTVRMPLGGGSVALRVPRGTVRRSDDTWSASAHVLLPERLGRSARVGLNLEGDPGRRETLSGRLQFEGQRLAFSGWRELLATWSSHARHVPAAGNGNVELRATLRSGVLERVTGEIAADEVRVTNVPAPVTIGYLNARWTAARVREGWRLDVNDLRAGAHGRDATPAALALDLDPTRRRAHAIVDLVPLEVLASAAQAFLPEVSLADLHLEGLARGLEIDWDAAEVAGARLKARADASNVAVAVPSRGFALSGASAQLIATDTELAIEFKAPAADLGFGQVHTRQWNDVRLAARVLAQKHKQGWQVSTERLIAEHEDGRLSLAATITGAEGAEPRVSLRATVSDASLDALRDVLFALPAPSAEKESLPAVARGRIEAGDFELAGPLGASPTSSGVERFSGSFGIRDAAVVGTDTWPSVEGIDAQVTWIGARFSAKVARGHAAGVQISTAQADWSVDGSGPLSASGRAYGRIEQGLEWLQAHPQLHGAARNVHEIDARGDALLDFAVTVPADAPAEPKVRLALILEGARVQPARAVPPIEALRGSLVLEDGRLRRTTLAGTWLGGPVSVRVNERRGRPGGPVTELHAQGLLDAAFAARAARFERAERLSGRTAWQGMLTISNGEAGATLAGHAETTLEGIASELPEPLSKAQADALPLRIEIDARDSQPPELRLTAAGRLRGMFALALATDGWRIERGSLRIGEGDATLPANPALVLAGHVARLDLPAWLAVGRTSARDLSRPPLWAELVADELDIAGRTFPRVELTAREDDDGLHLSAMSAALAGSVQIPRDPGTDRPIDISLTRLDIPSPGAAATAAELVAALAPAAQLRADNVTWEGRQLGRLNLGLSSDDEGVRVASLRLAGSAHDLRGGARCEPSLATCRLEFEVTSADAAQALRDFGFADDIDARRARLTAELDWQRQPDRSWLSALTGRVGYSLERGSVRSAGAGDATPFALFAIPALLAPEDATEDAAGLAFRRLAADYTLRDGQAVTSNLHLDGEAEILARGRVGLVDRDYEQVAWVLEGEERLPSAVRRFGASPRVAAAWLQLRDFFGGPEIEDSRAVLHLHGSWMRPIVGAPLQQDAAP